MHTFNANVFQKSRMTRVLVGFAILILLSWLCIGAYSNGNRESRWDDVSRWLVLTGPMFPVITSLLFMTARFNLVICGIMIAIHAIVYFVFVDRSPPIFSHSNKTLLFPTLSGMLLFPISLLWGWFISLAQFAHPKNADVLGD